MKKLYPLILILMMPAMLLAQAVTYPAHFTVAHDGSGNYKTIQEAVKNILAVNDNWDVSSIK